MKQKLLFMMLLLGAVVQGTWAVNGIYCTASDKGRVVCTDGTIYDNVAAATADGKTAVAMIFVVDEVNKKGLALALEEEGHMNQLRGIEVCDAKNKSLPVLGATWKLARRDEWDSMLFATIGNNERLLWQFSNVGGTNISGSDHWSSTPGTSGYAWKCGIPNGDWADHGTDAQCMVRACLAFNLLTVYEIGSQSDWNAFCAAVNNGDTFSDKYVKLTDNWISALEATAGTDEINSFQGIFDGNGNTITNNQGTAGPISYDYCAPFRHVKNARIKNLRVNGFLYTNGKYAAGIVAKSYGLLDLIDCRSSVYITSYRADNDYHGGLVAENNGTVFANRCIFDGSFAANAAHSNQTTYCGGFIGKTSKSSTTTIKNSILKPSSVAEGMVSNTFTGSTDGTVTIEDSYFVATDNLPTNQGMKVIATAPEGEIYRPITINGTTVYTDACTVSGVDASYNLDNGSVFITPVPTDPLAAALTFGTDFTVTLDGNAAQYLPVNISTAGSHTLVLTGTGKYTGTKTITITATGDPARSTTYISNEAEWNAFAEKVNDGTSTFAGQTVTLTADISVSQKVGTVTGSTQVNPFSGTFDGNGHTITATITDNSNGGTALFCYINNATIKDLTLAGTITGNMHAAALVGFSKGVDNKIQNCTVTANVSGGSHIGGIAGHALDSNISITDCVFSGLLTGGGSFKGVFVGWGDSGSRTVTDCLYVMADGQSTSNFDMVKNNGTLNVERCYKTTSAGSYGTQAYVAYGGEICTGLLATICGTAVYGRTCPVSGVDTYYTLGAGVSITPTVKDGDNTLALGTQYTAKLNDAAVTEFPISIGTKGYYTLTLTGTGDYVGEKVVRFVVLGDGDPQNVTSETTTMTSGTYKVYLDTTIPSRITITGDVVLNLGEGTTLTVPKGIELSSGNKLTINGTGALTINGCDDNNSGIGAYSVGTLVVNGGTINVTGGEGGAGIGGSVHNNTGGTIIINGGVVNVTGGEDGAGIGGGANDWQGEYGKCGDIIINGGQVTVRGGSDASGIGPGCDGTASGTLTLDWTNPTDFVYSNTYSMPSITFVKDYLLSGTDTKATSSNMGGQKIVPYIVDVMTLTDGESYTFTSSFAVNSATYRKTLGAERTGKYQPWLVPFDYTITAADVEKFTFWRLNMIANSPDPNVEAGTEVWVYLSRMKAGDVLYANMPYVYKPLTDMENYEFTTENAVLKAKNTGVIAKTETIDDVYSFYATYEPTLATAQDPFYYVNYKGHLSVGNNGTVTVGAFRWILRVESKSGSTPAKSRSIVFIDGDGTTGISLTPDPSPIGEGSGYWFTLDGRRLQGKPSRAGVYIYNGKKFVIK